MGLKLIILVGLFLAVTLLVSSEIVSARELDPTTGVINLAKAAEKTDSRHGGHGGGNGGKGHGGGNGGGKGAVWPSGGGHHGNGGGHGGKGGGGHGGGD